MQLWSAKLVNLQLGEIPSVPEIKDKAVEDIKVDVEEKVTKDVKQEVNQGVKEDVVELNEEKEVMGRG